MKNPFRGVGGRWFPPRTRNVEATRREAQQLKDRGNESLAQGNLGAAIACFRQAVARDPAFAEAFNNLGFALRQDNQLDEAASALAQAIALNPHLAQACLNLGMTEQERGRLADAASWLRRYLTLVPGQPEVMMRLGSVYCALGDYQEACEVLAGATEAMPNADAYCNLGYALKKCGRATEAQAAYERGLAIDPAHVDLLNNLGVLLKESGRLDEAAERYAEALRLCPNHARANNNQGILLAELRRYEEAEACYRRAVACDPRFGEASVNLGALLSGRQKRFAEAEEIYRRALDQTANDPNLRWNLGLLLLHTGRYGEAWPLLDARLDPRLNIVRPPELDYPPWAGEPLAGRTVLIVGEQGHGDEIQFARYAAVLKQLGAVQVHVACKRPLCALFRSLTGIDSVVPFDEPQGFPACDYWVLSFSLPQHCRTTLDTIPATLPYLQAPADGVARWRDRLPRDGLKVGLAWRGSSLHKNDRNRSLPGLDTLSPIYTLPGLSAVSLQTGSEPGAASDPADRPIAWLGGDITDFADTAAIVSQLDLVICVDTAVAHLAGALAVPCWVMLPYVDTDWRWLEGRKDSPWYPSVLRLFRQPRPDDWDSVVADVVVALEEFMSCRTSKTGAP